MHDTMKISTTAVLLATDSHSVGKVEMKILEQLFDHMADTAFFIKDLAGRYLAVNDSLVERHGLRNKSQLLGRRPCDVCAGDFGRIPAEQDAYVISNGRAIVERLEFVTIFSPDIHRRTCGSLRLQRNYLHFYGN